MAAEIKKARGLEVQLVKGGNGIFDVHQDERMVFSKYESHRFPELDEVLAGLK